MKYVILLLIFTVIACSKPTINRNALTANNWELINVVKLPTEKIFHEDLHRGTVWNFNENGTFQIETINDFRNTKYNGTWELNGTVLKTFEKSDTTILKIEKLTNSEINWTMNKKNEIRFYFKAIEKNKKPAANTK